MTKFKSIIQPVVLALTATMIFCASSTAGTISGRITCNGNGVSGIAVSDGYIVTTTDSTGNYSFNSQKKNGYVFYSIPAGYEPIAKDKKDNFVPPFWAHLKSKDIDKSETHDFRLKKVQNDIFSMVVGADIHLANRVNDVKQFGDLFMTSIDRLVSSHPSNKFYSMFLGDISWDVYWYENNYGLKSVKKTLAKDRYPMLLFPVMGNHDNNPATPCDSMTDFNASSMFRQVMAPNYYSYNIGKIHFVVLDDIVYKNEPSLGKKSNKGVVGKRNYEAYITPEQIKWLEKDLALVTDKTTPIIIGMHIPAWKLDTSNNYKAVGKLKGNSNAQLANAVKDFSRVIILSGHTHYNYHAHPADIPNLKENNIAAVCATWWNTVPLSARHIGNDGSPGGYNIYNFNGKDISWKYITIDKVDSVGFSQFRAYDMNIIRNFYKTDERAVKLIQFFPKRVDFSKAEDNEILINVFNYDTDWKIEVVENGVPLDIKRISTEDPLHTLCFDLPTFKSKGWRFGANSGTIRNTHMFVAKAKSAEAPVIIKVTDSFGNVYTLTMVRPKQFTVDMQ